ncbi:MAG: HAD-IB family phosphatase [Gloeomargaritaceae cyanobacterium C42_A2020_066]|nr:HAD-IB family phosphatase [Gloeomargaritaceae cyanobacterium C42_A2020_066]
MFFCDFDGTITAEETFVGMVERVVPDLAAQILPDLFARRLSLRQGVRQLLEAMPAAAFTRILDYADQQPVRPGLAALMAWVEAQGMPFVVVSGGVQAMVEQVLAREGLRQRVAAIAAVQVQPKGDFMEVISPWEGGTELVEKAAVMAQYPQRPWIMAGDSVTDINMAIQADVVFARDRLQGYLDQIGKPYIPWETFFDIRDYLRQSPIRPMSHTNG